MHTARRCRHPGSIRRLHRHHHGLGPTTRHAGSLHRQGSARTPASRTSGRVCPCCTRHPARHSGRASTAARPPSKRRIRSSGYGMLRLSCWSRHEPEHSVLPHITRIEQLLTADLPTFFHREISAARMRTRPDVQRRVPHRRPRPCCPSRPRVTPARTGGRSRSRKCCRTGRPSRAADRRSAGAARRTRSRSPLRRCRSRGR